MPPRSGRSDAQTITDLIGAVEAVAAAGGLIPISPQNPINELLDQLRPGSGLAAGLASGATGAVRLPHPPGISQGGGPVVLDLPQPASPGQNAQGDSAQQANHPHQPGGDSRVAHDQRASDLRAIEFLLQRIDELTVEAEKAERAEPRAYIGASVIGSKCEAYLALNLRGFPSDMPDGQLLRIFNEGHKAEPFVVETLKRAGLRIRELDPETGKQWHYNMLGGHLAANLDGKLWKQRDPEKDKATHTLEVKSMNRQMFDTFKKKGVAISHPDYYDQVQLGMGFSEIHACLFAAYCKDNSAFHFEFVYFDAAHFNALVARGANAMFAPQAKRLESWDCTQCFKRTACKVAIAPPPEMRHCRHCRYSIPDVSQPGKMWTCKLHHGLHVSIPCSDFAVYQTIAIKEAK